MALAKFFNARVTRILAAAIAFVIALPVVAISAFFAVLFLAGPHGGALPSWMAPMVLASGWLAVLLLPVMFARRIWLRNPLGDKRGEVRGSKLPRS